MILVRTPFRLPLGGGGTDLPAYYKKFGGHLITATINKYMFISITQPALVEGAVVKADHGRAASEGIKDIDIDRRDSVTVQQLELVYVFMKELGKQLSMSYSYVERDTSEIRSEHGNSVSAGESAASKAM